MITVQRSLDISPGSDDGAENHETKGKENDGGDAATKPENFTISDNNDGQVLEDGEDGNRKELESLSGGVDHTSKQSGNREPCNRCQHSLPYILSVINHIHLFAFSLSNGARLVMRPICLQAKIAPIQQVF